jgi:hypothetical protein
MWPSNLFDAVGMPIAFAKFVQLTTSRKRFGQIENPNRGRTWLKKVTRK